MSEKLNSGVKVQSPIAKRLHEDLTEVLRNGSEEEVLRGLLEVQLVHVCAFAHYRRLVGLSEFKKDKEVMDRAFERVREFQARHSLTIN